MKTILYLLSFLLLLSPALAWNITSFEQGTCHNTSLNPGETFGVNLIGFTNSYWNNLTINMTGYLSSDEFPYIDDFENGYSNRWLTPINISGQGAAQFNQEGANTRINISTVYTRSINHSLGSNLSTGQINITFDYFIKSANGQHIWIGDIIESEWGNTSGFDMFINGAGFNAYNGTRVDVIPGCAVNGHHTITILIDMGATRPYANWSCDSNPFVTDMTARTKDPTKINTIFYSTDTGGFMLMDNLTISNNYGASYHSNLSVNLNNTLEQYHNTSIFNGTAITTFNNNDIHNVLQQTNNLSIWYNTNATGYLYTCLMSAEYNNYLNLSILDEDTLTLINENVTIEISQDNITNYYWTTNGTLFLFDEFYGEYTVGVYNNNYAKRIYATTFSNNESKNLTVYLGNRSNSVIFIIKNKITGDNLESAIVNQYRNIDGTSTLVSSVFSDINGQAQFTYATGIRYTFTVTLDGYLIKEFILDPIISEQYTILMEPTGLTGSDTDWYGVTPYMSTTTFINNTLNNLTIGLSSPGEFLVNYNITITYPGGTQTHAGSTSTGENFITTFTITDALINDSVQITYQYAHTLGSTREYKYSYLIDTAESGTMLGLKRGTYGIGLLERVLIMIFLSLIVGGAIAGFTGSRESGVVIAFLIQGIIAYLLNISVLFIFPGILAGLLIISRRTT